MATVYEYSEGRLIRARRARPWSAWFQLILGIWLGISPWVLGFTGASVQGGGQSGGGVGLLNGPATTLIAATWNAWILGGLVVLLALSLIIVGLRFWQEHVLLVCGAWVFAAPWVLGFYHWWPIASWDQWLTGLFIFLFSAWALPSGPPSR